MKLNYLIDLVYNGLTLNPFHRLLTDKIRDKITAKQSADPSIAQNTEKNIQQKIRQLRESGTTSIQSFERTQSQLTTRVAIKEWLDLHKIQNYTIREDLSVDVQGDVDLQRTKQDHTNSIPPLTRLPIQFRAVRGSFYISGHALTSLEGAPIIVHGDFNCQSNELTTLKGAPGSVHGHFNCSSNLLKTLEFAPLYIGKALACESNQLKDFTYCPLKVMGNVIWCSDNPRLGEYQHIEDFSIIKAEHLRIQTILREARELDEVLELTGMKHSRSGLKI